MDPFPRHEALALIRRVPAYGHLAWRLGRDPALPSSRRGAVLAAAAYLVSPIDAIPGIVPLLGQLDDVLVVVLALRFALAGLSIEQRRRHLEAAGLSEDLLATDEQTLRDLAAWVARAGARAGVRMTRLGTQAGVAISAAGVRAGTRLARRVGDAAAKGASRLVRRDPALS
jgi:uncharacterized membrane protein YkvA (DUF1232 family)